MNDAFHAFWGPSLGATQCLTVSRAPAGGERVLGHTSLHISGAQIPVYVSIGCTHAFLSPHVFANPWHYWTVFSSASPWWWQGMSPCWAVFSVQGQLLISAHLGGVCLPWVLMPELSCVPQSSHGGPRGEGHSTHRCAQRVTVCSWRGLWAGSPCSVSCLPAAGSHTSGQLPDAKTWGAATGQWPAQPAPAAHSPGPALTCLPLCFPAAIVQPALRHQAVS